MKRIVALGMAINILWGHSVVEAAPRCRTIESAVAVQKNVVVGAGFTVVPFAVPVAVPVATVQPPTVLYSYTAPHTSYPTQQDETERSLPDAEALEATTLINQKCAQCHGGEAPKAGLDLSDPSTLNPEQRLKAIARVVSDDADLRMPKSGTLSPGEIGQVLQALSASE